MAGITICTNHHCPMAERCYRHKAKPSEPWQSYVHFEPDSEGHCEHFLALRMVGGMRLSPSEDLAQ